MLFLTTYHVRDEIRTRPERWAELLAFYAAEGDPPGTVAHYVQVDGSAGYTLREVDDLSDAYEATLAFERYLDLTVAPVLPVGDAVTKLLARYGA
jgi:hypothetical protein